MTPSCFFIRFIQGEKTYTEPQTYPEEIWNINCIKSDFTDFRNCSKRLAVHGTMEWLYISQKREVNAFDRQNGRMREMKYWIENLHHPLAWHNCEIILCVEVFYLNSTWWWWGFNTHHLKITVFFHWQNMKLLFSFLSLISPSETYGFFPIGNYVSVSLTLLQAHLILISFTSCSPFFESSITCKKIVPWLLAF